MPINRQNPGRTFQVLCQQFGDMRQGATFTDYDFRRKNTALPPNVSNNDPQAIDDYYGDILDGHLESTPPPIAIIAPAVEPAVANPIDPSRPMNQQGATFAPTTGPQRQQSPDHTQNQTFPDNASDIEICIVVLSDLAGNPVAGGIYQVQFAGLLLPPAITEQRFYFALQSLQQEGALEQNSMFIRFGDGLIAEAQRLKEAWLLKGRAADLPPEGDTISSETTPKERWHKRKVKGIASEMDSLTTKWIALGIVILVVIVSILALNRYFHLGIPIKPIIDKINPWATTKP